MKKTNFLKGLALAAVALVSGFTTSCSEEELSIKNNPIELPAASASVSISVVDLEVGELVGSVTTIDATASIGGTITVECPGVTGYTVAAPIEVAIPALQKGQYVNVPVTFYVVTLESALAALMDGTYLTFEKADDVKRTETPIAFTESSKGWVGLTASNTDETAPLTVWASFKYKNGYEFVSEIESKAAETQIMDLLKLVKPSVQTWNRFEWTIEPMTAINVDLNQAIMEGVVSVIDYEDGEVLAKFNGKYYGLSLGWMTEIITHDNGHDAPTHDGHDGHGHGGNSNAGGGTGDDAGE